MPNIITFYDIPGKASTNVAWSPNTWRTRYVLHIKGLAYRTVWLEYPDIKQAMKELGAQPTGTRDGAPLYTLPVIHDPTTGAVVAESLQICKYLDEQYPDTPRLLPTPSRALQVAFLNTYVGECLMGPTLSLVVGHSARQLNPRSEEYFRWMMTKVLGKPEEEVARTAEDREALLKKLINAMEQLGGWKGEYPFLGGDVVSYADVLVAAPLKWFALVGDESEWDRVQKAIAEKWGSFLKAFSEWEVIPM
ncbi:hypothetical protein BV25DRAFT_1830054 [Artomyces pyxidatus]|uniref:Uncharacterized protein n=1 Tax=Artomyces pyxidatus TaxID=48021 RepID=A0ACB8SPW6_9AGAM|nr:hypothetical protein BV25DRAFT_1830054 [Artomyces pyxidatus]